MSQKIFDKIIIGAGSAGCVLARRLSEGSHLQILVVEAGPVDHRLDFRLHMPAALTYPLAGQTYNWRYRSGPEPHLDGRFIEQPRGRVLGGSSSINGMIYIRGNPLDFEKWAALPGLKSWSYAHVLPYFKRIENRLAGADLYHGDAGPLVLTTPNCENPLFDAFFEAVQQAGYPLTDDVNGYQQEGFGRFDRTTYQGRRMNAARAYLHPVLKRSNLTVRTGVEVDQILFDGKRAIGIRMGSEQVFAQEVICCGGAINSPLLLQRSGVGDPDLLRSHGIPVVQGLQGVGENLQDHLEVYIQYACKQPISLYPALKWWRAPWIGAQWLFGRRGVGASNHFEAGGFIRSNDEVPYPNLQYHFLPLAIRYDGSSPEQGHGYQVHVGPMNTDVRGWVRIGGQKRTDSPEIIFNYLGTANEKKEWLEAVRITRRIMNQPAFDSFRAAEIAPGPDVQTDAEILDFLKRQVESAYHPSCTCKMGLDEAAVVGPDFTVHGVQGLRVVDASVMPAITNGNIHAPVLMMAEKAADIILGKELLPPEHAPFYRKGA